MPLPQMQTKISNSGDRCEFFHKKGLDRCFNLLYYRASLILERGKLWEKSGQNEPAHTDAPGSDSIASQL